MVCLKGVDVMVEDVVFLFDLLVVVVVGYVLFEVEVIVLMICVCDDSNIVVDYYFGLFYV